jgi:adenylate cyclase
MAILAADAVGYSRLISMDEEGTLTRFADRVSGVVQPAIQSHGGRIFKTTGDGLLSVFPSVISAVQCALAVQTALAEREADADEPLAFRIGLHAADVVIEGDDVFGDGVNVASRLEALAEPGGICVSARVQEDAQGRLPAQFVDLGPQKLKNIPRPVRAYRVRSGATTEPPQSLPLPSKPSVVVLPFENRGGDPEQEYLADAITEDIITALSRWRWFFVIGRNTSFAYKGRAVQAAEVGRELGVRYILQGAVRRSKDRLRLTAELVDAATAANLWTERFEGDATDVLTLQDRMTEQLVGALEPAMLHTEGARAGRKDVADFDALDCFQRGMWHLNKVSEQGCRSALDLFHQALARDPELALGYVGIARAHYGLAVYGWSPDPLADLGKSRQAAAEAIRLDPRDAYGHFAASGAALYLHRHREALEEARATIALNPNFALGHFRLGQVLLYAGRPQEAIAPLERCLRYSPYDPQWGSMLSVLALAHFHAGAYAEAARYADDAAERLAVRARAIQAASLARMGRLDEARAAFTPDLQARVERWRVRLAPYARTEDREDFVGALRLAGVGDVALAAIS